MSIYKIIVPGTKIDIELEADRMEKNSAGAVVFYRTDHPGEIINSGDLEQMTDLQLELAKKRESIIGAFPRETVAYEIGKSTWEGKEEKIVEFLFKVKDSTENESENDTSEDIQLRRQVIKDFDIYLLPIYKIISGLETKTEEE